MKWIIFVCFGVLLTACKLGEDLEVQDMGDSPGYFVECYCRPGEMYELTATYIAPIAKDQVLDYSLEFDVYVVAEERIKLFQSLFSKPDSKFIYNYATNRRLSRELTDTIFLEIVSPGGEKISGWTEIPDEVKIDTVMISGSSISTSFYTSSDVRQNYFILTTQIMIGGKVKDRSVYYLGNYTGEQMIEKKQKIEILQEADRVVVNLKRVTETCYKYQLSLHQSGSSNQDNITSPVPLMGNLAGAMGIFTCYTEDCFKIDLLTDN